MERDARMQRGERPFIFTNLKDGTGLDAVVHWLEQQMTRSLAQRHRVLDIHTAHNIEHVHHHH